MASQIRVTMVKFELQADDTGNVDFSGVTTRNVRVLNSDKKNFGTLI